MTGLRVWLQPAKARMARALGEPFVPDGKTVVGRWPTTNQRPNVWGSANALLTNQTLRRFGGRQPLCGIGVKSLMERTSMPAAASARIADSRPDPGPLTRTSTERTPWSRAMLAAFIAACCAANGVPLRDPRKPSEPELFQEITLPAMSVMVTIVLLKDACTCTSPCGMCLRSFFLNVFFLPFFSGAAAPPPAAAGLAISVLSSPFSVTSAHVPLRTENRELRTCF